MKRILYILLLLSFPVIGQVNVWTYDTANGGNNNGVIEQSELQAALDNEANLIVSPATTITINSLVALDQIAVQTVDFGGSILEKNFTSDYALWINKAGMLGANTTLSNFELDCNSNYGQAMYCNSRTNLTNAEIHSVVENDANSAPRGISITVNDAVGARGEWRFNNVHIHDIRNTDREFDGPLPHTTQPGAGWGAGLEIFWNAVVSGTGMQFVMINSQVNDVYGDEASGVMVNSPLIDISNTNNTLWFENVTIKDCERRAVKGYIGNQTWINCNIHQVDRTNPNIDTRTAPAGLFNIGNRSSSVGANNNLVCGTTFHAAPTTPFDAWESDFWIGGDLGKNGTSIEFRNCTFESGDDVNTSWANAGAEMEIYGEINGFKICNSSFGIASTAARGFKLDKGSGFALQGGAKMQIDLNNTYTNTEAKFLEDFTATTEYIISDLSGDCDVCPTAGGATTGNITDIIFDSSGTSDVYVDEETPTPSWTISEVTDEIGEGYTFQNLGTGNDHQYFTVADSTIQMTITPDYELSLDFGNNKIYSFNVRVTSTSGVFHDELMVIHINDIVEGGDVPVTSIAFDNPVQTIMIGETVDNSHTFNGGVSTPNNTNVIYISSDPDILTPDGNGSMAGGVTYTIRSEDTTNGTIEHTMTVTVIIPPKKRVKISGGNKLGNGHQMYINY